MIDCEVLEDALKKGKREKCYIFCGTDEKLIKDSVEHIVSGVITKDFMDFNYIKYDGNKIDINDILNACETLPFLSEKKVVLVYRAVFLSDKEDKENKKRFDDINKYIDNLPEHCILIIYYVFEEDREKPGNNLKKLDKKCCVIKADKLKGEKFYRKVKGVFESRGKDIGKVELRYFCDNVENNLNIVIREVDKLINYCDIRNITRVDIDKLLPPKTDNDIFDLVDYLSQKRPEKAIEILNELMYRGENILGVLAMVQRQFKLLLNIGLKLEQGTNKETIIKELRLHPYIGEKLIAQTKKFSFSQLKKCMELCLNTERVLKSSQTDKKTEMELLIINTVKA